MLTCRLEQAPALVGDSGHSDSSSTHAVHDRVCRQIDCSSWPAFTLTLAAMLPQNPLGYAAFHYLMSALHALHRRHSAGHRLRTLLPVILKPVTAEPSNSNEPSESEGSTGGDEQDMVYLDKFLNCSHWVMPSVPEVISAAGAAGIDIRSGWLSFAQEQIFPQCLNSESECFLGMVLHGLTMRSVVGKLHTMQQIKEAGPKNIFEEALLILLPPEDPEDAQEVEKSVNYGPPMQRLHAALTTCLLLHAVQLHKQLAINQRIFNLKVRFSANSAVV